MRIAVSLIFLLANLAFAAGEPVDILVKQLEQIDTFQARFSQKLTDREGDLLQETKGEIKLQRPGKFFWQVSPPYEQLIVSNGVKLWVYDADLEQATLRSSSELQNTPAEILSGNFSSIKNSYTVRLGDSGKNKKLTRYELTPKGEGDFAKMAFVFKKDALVEFLIEDKLGQTTQVAFKKAKLNKAIKAAIFDFQPPEGTDIVVNENVAQSGSF